MNKKSCYEPCNYQLLLSSFQQRRNAVAEIFLVFHLNIFRGLSANIVVYFASRKVLHRSKIHFSSLVVKRSSSINVCALFRHFSNQIPLNISNYVVVWNELAGLPRLSSIIFEIFF